MNKYLIIILKIFDISLNKIERNIKIEKTILDGTYKLKSCIIHIGTSKSSVHYVFYLFNDDNTVHIINDVGKSITQVPNPTDISGGYVYIYERINYIPDKLEQSMKELDKQITDPQLMMFQKYLMNEHNKFIKSSFYCINKVLPSYIILPIHTLSIKLTLVVPFKYIVILW